MQIAGLVFNLVWALLRLLLALPRRDGGRAVESRVLAEIYRHALQAVFRGNEARERQSRLDADAGRLRDTDGFKRK